MILNIMRFICLVRDNSSQRKNLEHLQGDLPRPSIRNKKRIALNLVYFNNDLGTYYQKFFLAIDIQDVLKVGTNFYTFNENIWG